MPELNVKSVYDTYAAMVYGMALKLVNDPVIAEKVLIKLFRKMHEERLNEKNQNVVCAILIKLTISMSKSESNFEVNHEAIIFNETPNIKALLFGKPIGDSENTNDVVVNKVNAQKIRAEFRRLRENDEEVLKS